MKSGDVRQSQLAAFRQSQPFGFQHPGHMKFDAPALVNQRKFILGQDAQAIGKRLPEEHGVGMPDQVQPGRIVVVLGFPARLPVPQVPIQNGIEPQQEERFVGRGIGKVRKDVGLKHRRGVGHGGMGQEVGNDRVVHPAAGPEENLVRLAGQPVHAAGKAVHRSVDRQPHAGEDRRAQGHPQQHRRGPGGMTRHLAQAEPTEQPEKRDHGESTSRPSARFSRRPA